MFGKPSRIAPLVMLAVAMATACNKGRAEPASTPPVSAVEVPAVPPGTETAQARAPRLDREPPPDEADDDEPLDIEVTEDAGSIRFSTSSDGGVRFWGHLTVIDGGFSFSGSFSTSPGRDAGPP